MAEVPGAATAVQGVAARIWMGGSRFLPELVVQRLHACPRDEVGATFHDDLRGCAEETRAWALEAAESAGLDVRSRLTIEVVETAFVDPAELESLPVAPNARPEPNPVFEALALAGEEQRFANRAEYRRAVAAHAAWKAALVDEGDPTASGTAYQQGFLRDLGLTLGVADRTARNLVHAVDRLQRVLPTVWTRFEAAEVPWRAMQAAHAAVDGLHDDVLPLFDEAAAALMVEKPVVELPDAFRRLAERLQASTADERFEKAFAKRHVTIEKGTDGMGWLNAYLPMTTLLAVDQQLTKAAIAARGAADDPAPGIGVLKADILADGIVDALSRDADPARDGVLVPQRRGVKARVAVLIPAMTALGHSDEPATLQGYGVIGMKTALRLAGEAKSWIRVLTDPFSGAVLNIGRRRYRPTADMRTLLRLLDGGGRGPGDIRGPDGTEVDHNRSFRLHDEQGETSIDNLMLLSHLDHALKTAGEVDVGMLRDRTALWGTRAGNRYVTRPKDPPGPTPIPPELIDPDDCPF
jgi:hypothetical protein